MHPLNASAYNRAMTNLASACVRSFLVLFTWLTVVPALAHASDEPPSTLTLDRMDSATRVGVQIGFDKLDSASLSDVFVMRFNPYGQYVLPNHMVGIYGQLPVAHVFNFNGADATGMGNLDLGAFLLPFHTSELILRAGVALGTATDSRDGRIANYDSAFERLTDFMLVAPNYTTLRLSASTVQQSGMAFLRIDGGLELALDKPSTGNSTFVRGNIAGGLRTAAVDLSVELVTTGTLDGNGDVSSRFVHTLSAGFRSQGPDQVYGGFVLPLDEGIRGEIWIITFGYQHVMN